MAENAIALNGLNAQSHTHFSRFVVPILMYRHEQANPDDPKPTLAISGIVTVSSEGFCHIIAHKAFLFPKDAHRFRYEVVFPNGTTVRLEDLSVQTRGKLAAFYCPIVTGTVDAVQFGNHITINQKLKMYFYQINKAGQLVKDVTDGYVTHVAEDYVAHDCPPASVSRRGSPVFNEERQLVAISFEHAGVTKALDKQHITALLASFYEGMDNMPLSEILKHIKVVGERELR